LDLYFVRHQPMNSSANWFNSTARFRFLPRVNVDLDGVNSNGTEVADNATTYISGVCRALTNATAPDTVTFVKLPVLFEVFAEAEGTLFASSANVVNCLVHPGHGIFMQDTGSDAFVNAGLEMYHLGAVCVPGEHVLRIQQLKG
jgi:hypothetical protein